MQYFWALVLILIILEYIYMKKMKKGTVQFIVLILIILEYIYIGLYNVVYKGVSDCLNPYYTGIHLHEFGDIVFSVTQRCLNPYYTGIHLHKNNSMRQKNFILSLNPYYTGIHLHTFEGPRRL